MKRSWPIAKTLYWGAVGLVLAAILHVSMVLAAPQMANRTAWATLQPQLPVNTMRVLPAVRPGAQPLPFLAPDVRYAMCRYDLATGPLGITGRLLDATWSVTLYTPQGESWFAATFAELQRADLELTVQPAAERSLLDEIQASLLRAQPRESRGQREAGIVATSPTREGLVVLRAPLLGLAFGKETEAALAAAKCRSLKR